MKKKKKQETVLTEELVLNKNLKMNDDLKKIITSAENGKYDYFDYSNEIIQKIALINDENDFTVQNLRPIIQALFPKYLICSGLFEPFIMFEIKNNVRVDPPKFHYKTLFDFLNNDDTKQFNKLSDEIRNLFEVNSIRYSSLWEKVFKKTTSNKEGNNNE